MSVKNAAEKTPLTRALLLAILRGQLKYHEALGIGSYPVTDDLQRFFELTDSKMKILSGLQQSQYKNEIEPRITGQSARKQDKPDFLRQEISSCTLCHLSQQKSGIVPGTVNQAPSLMVVGDWSQQGKDVFSQEIMFGPEEDAMLWRMMAAIDLKPEDIYVTNCLKCCPGEGVVPDSASEQSCFSFLEREIAMLKPGIICAMGELATRMLTGSTEPLARLRGRFIKYRYQSKQAIFVVPTYHPRFLLQQQEMKKATWLDLQAIKKRLAAK